MAFNTQKFMAAQFQPRIEEIHVPALGDWFDDPANDAYLWKVRGQTANEVARATDASEKHKNLDAIIKAISSNQNQIVELKKAIGVETDTPAAIIKRLEQLVQCSVDPVITLDVAVKLAETRPIEFYQLTNEILRLTGLGMDVKKPKASGETTTSEA